MAKNTSSSSDDVTVFLDTSLDTRLAVTVSAADSIADLKLKFEHEHRLSYGGIKIRSLKVDRRGCLYCLSDSMSVKRAAGGGEECFLFAGAVVVEKIGEMHGLRNVGSGVCDNRLVSGVDCPVGDSGMLLLGGNENNVVERNGAVDFDRGTLKDLEMGIKGCDDDRRGTLCGETIKRPERETQEDTSRKEASKGNSASLEKSSLAVKNKLHVAKQKSEEPVHKDNDVPVHGIGEEPSRVDSVNPEDTLGNKGWDVRGDTFDVNKTTSEEPSRAFASDLDNRSDTGIHGTNDTYKETEVSEKETEIRKRKVESKTNLEKKAAGDAAQLQTASKKKRKFESATDLEDLVKGNNVLIKGSSQKDASQSLTAIKKKRKLHNKTNEDSSKEKKEAFQPEIASEQLAGKTASTKLTESSTKKKNNKKNKALNPQHQVVDAAPPRSDKMEDKSMVASAEINVKHSSGEDVAPTSTQGPKEDNCAPIREMHEIPKVWPSLEINKATREKPDDQVPVVEAPGANETSSAERIQDKREPSQTNDAEAMLSKSQDKADGNNAKLSVTSELSNINEAVIPSKRKKKSKTKSSTGVEQVIVSQYDISMAESREGVHGVQDIDKAKNKQSDLSQENAKDLLEKDTYRGPLVTEADKNDGTEVVTAQKVGKTSESAKSAKKKLKRKHDAVAEDLQKLDAGEKNASRGDPAVTVDSRTEALGGKRKNSKLAKTSPVDQLNVKHPETGGDIGLQIGTPDFQSNIISESTKDPSQQEHISTGTSLQPNVTSNHEEVSCEGEEVEFYKYMVPNKSKSDIVASGEPCAEEVTMSKEAGNKLMPKVNRKVVDSSGSSHNLQCLLKPQDNQGTGGKASRSSSKQPQGSMPNVDVVPSKPAKTVPKNKTKAQSSDASGKITSSITVAGKKTPAHSISKKKNEAVSVPSSKAEKANRTGQNKLVKKQQSGVTQNVVASGKTSGSGDGEVLNSSKHEKNATTPVNPVYTNGSAGKVGVVSAANFSATSSEYSLSSESDYSDGESNAGSCASSGKTRTGKSGYSSIKGKPGKRLMIDEIFSKSSVYKKAKLSASQSQYEEDSQGPEFVPESQPAL